jgi:hypothetical protein
LATIYDWMVPEVICVFCHPLHNICHTVLARMVSDFRAQRHTFLRSWTRICTLVACGCYPSLTVLYAHHFREPIFYLGSNVLMLLTAQSVIFVATCSPNGHQQLRPSQEHQQFHCTLEESTKTQSRCSLVTSLDHMLALTFTFLASCIFINASRARNRSRFAGLVPLAVRQLFLYEFGQQGSQR